MPKIKIPKKTLRYLAAIIIPVIVMLASYFNLFETFELSTLDLRFKARPAQKATGDIVLIEIAEDTLEKIGQWPIDRKFHAALVDTLSAVGAKAIIFDMLFSTKSSHESDMRLIEAASGAKNVYFPVALRLSEDRPKGIFLEAIAIESEPFPDLLKTARGIGHINATTDIDGKRRKVPLFISYMDKVVPQISLLAVCDMLGVSISDIKVEKGKYIRLDKDTVIPVDARGQMMINYAGYWGQAFRHFSFIDILTSYRDLHEGRQGVVDLEQLRDKICIIGLTAVATHDLNPIPLQERYPMVGLHANLINTILLKNFIVRVTPVVNVLILVFLSGLITLAVIKLKPVFEVLSVALIFLGFIAIAFGLFAFFNVWIDLFYPLFLIIGVYVFCTFQQYVAEQNKRALMQRDLDIAKRIQQSFLKQSPPEKEGIDIWFKLESAKSIGGDLYDFVLNNDDSLGIMVGDVSGKGVPAALFMAMTVSNFRFHSKTEIDPVRVISQLNDHIATESTAGLFVTLTYLNVDTKNMKLSIVDAGHLPVVFAGKDKETVFVTAKTGMALGIMDGIEFTRDQIPMEIGDVFVLYSDGVTEARNTSKEEFGEDRLKACVNKYKDLTAKEITEKLYNEILSFRKRAPQHDDITIMVLKVK